VPSPAQIAQPTLAELSVRYRVPLRRFFERRLRNNADPEDLVQEVFVRLVRHSNLNSIAHIGGYVFQIAANVLRDYARRRAVRAVENGPISLAEEEFEGGFPPERVLMARESLELLVAALYELPERTRVIFSLYHFESVPQIEISRRLGLPLSTVEKHMSRANLHLLDVLGRAQ
jgi:RNA polymerase sigma-70 factor (ECF subfamily)